MMKRFATMASVVLCGHGMLAQQFQHIQAYRINDYTGSKFGWSMAVADDRLVVGIPHAFSQSGLAAIYAIDDIAWTTVTGETIEEENSAPPLDQRFGAVVAAGGGMVAVGSCSTYGTDQYCNDLAQWVSIYRSVGGSWQYAQSIPAPAGVSGNFGKSIAISDDHLAVGGGRATVDGVVQDVVFLFARNGDFWTPVPMDTLAGIAGTDTGNGSFGHALSLRTDRLLVGASGDDEIGIDCGAAYLFGKDQGGPNAWGLIRKLLPSDGVAGDRFGFAVALNDDRAVVGAPLRKNGAVAYGGAYVFQRDAGATNNWGEVTRMTPLDPHADMQYGASVALNEERIAVGAPFDTFTENGTDGSVEVFVQEGDGWTFAQRIVPYWDGHVSQVSRSGTSLTFARDKLLIGAPFAIVDDSTPTPTGAVLVYGDPALGILDLADMKLNCYPNPFLEGFQLSTKQIPSGVVVSITDPLGRTVRTIDPKVTSAGVFVSREGLAPGSYWVLLTDRLSGGVIGRTSVVAQ